LPRFAKVYKESLGSLGSLEKEIQEKKSNIGRVPIKIKNDFFYVFK
jgi:hypothetical protein